MDLRNEKINYENPLLSLKIFCSTRQPDTLLQSSENRNTGVRWHYHKELEILAVLQGSMDVYIEEELHPIHDGDVVLIGSSQLHYDRGSKNNTLTYLCLQFDLRQFFDQTTMPYIKYFSETTHPLSHLNYIFHDAPDVKMNIHNCVREIYREFCQKDKGYEIAINVLVQKIILLLLRNDRRKMLNYEEGHDIFRLKPVLDFVEKNIAGKITVEDACKLSNISYYYFVKYFKKVFGMTFLEYINYRKIKIAEKMLLTKDMSITEVAYAVGMPNMAHFYKVFKRYNLCSPKEFKKKMLALIHYS